MAKPIPATPVLKGEDAKSLLQAVNKKQTPENKKALKEALRFLDKAARQISSKDSGREG